MNRVCPNYALEMVLAQNGGGGTASVARAFDVSRDKPNHRQTLEAYKDLGVPPVLADLLAVEDAEVALRVYLLDNSGSMATGDGHVLKSSVGRPPESYPSTRWEELSSMAANHARWNMKLGVPCEFVLLNSPSPHDPKEGQDIFRIDQKTGNPQHQLESMESKLRNSRPGGGTPLSERLEDLRRRLQASKQALLEGNRKVLLTIATDGLPSGPRETFIHTIRRMTQELPIFIVIRLCTDDDNVAGFYDAVDKEVELPLDIVDDLRGEAVNIYRLNPWLTYSPVLHTIREAGTLSKVFDFMDERTLTSAEVALCAQLILQKASTGSMPAYPRQPEAFLAAVDKDLLSAPVVYDGRTGRMNPPLNVKALQVAVHPSKHAIPAKMLQAVGLGNLADWYYTGKRPESLFGNQSDPVQDVSDADSAAWLQSSLCAIQNQNQSFIAVAPVPGQQMEYHSRTNGGWVRCTISKVDVGTGSIMVDVKPGMWITVQQQISCMRPLQNPIPTARPDPMPPMRVSGAPATAQNCPAPTGNVMLPPASSGGNFALGQQLEYNSPSLGAWIPCVVTHVNPSSGAIMVNVKAGQWLTKEQQAVALRPAGPRTVPDPAIMVNQPPVTKRPETQLNVPAPRGDNVLPPGEIMNASFWEGVITQPGSSSEGLSSAMPRAKAAPMGSLSEGLHPKPKASDGYPHSASSNSASPYPQTPSGSSLIPPPQSVPTNLQSAGPVLTRSSSMNWSVEDVAQFLESIELPHLVKKFRENGVDGLMLHELSEEDLTTELGCTKLQARKIRQRHA